MGLDVASLEVRPTPWALCCVLQAITEQFLQCGRALCPAGGGCRCWGILLPWGVCLVCNNVCIAGVCLSNININAKTKAFLAEHCLVLRYSLFFSSAVSVFFLRYFMGLR